MYIVYRYIVNNNDINSIYEYTIILTDQRDIKMIN